MLERGQSSPQLGILLATGVNTEILIPLGFLGVKLARDCVELTLGRFEPPANILGRSLSSAIFDYQLIIHTPFEGLEVRGWLHCCPFVADEILPAWLRGS